MLHCWKEAQIQQLSKRTKVQAARENTLCSKRVQQRQTGVGVERQPEMPSALAVFANTFTSKLDTSIRAGHTPSTPFQILLSECADAHPCSPR